MLPLVTDSSEAIIRKRVDFPHPLGPSKTKNSDDCTSMETESSAM
jgi:hypothetical protein